jgi:hypothetical protein
MNGTNVIILNNEPFRKRNTYFIKKRTFTVSDRNVSILEIGFVPALMCFITTFESKKRNQHCYVEWKHPITAEVVSMNYEELNAVEIKFN